MDPLSARPGRRSHRIADALTALRRRVLRRRRLIAVVLLGVATLASLRALSPPPPSATTVTVAARDLPAGTVLAPGDLQPVAMPPAVVPEGVVGDPVGSVLATPVRAGEPVTDVRLVGADLVSAQPTGTVAAPVRLADAGQVALLRTGDRIDLLATDPQAGTTLEVASCVSVLAVPDARHAGDDALPGRLIVAGLQAADVDDATTASVATYVTYTWCRG